MGVGKMYRILHAMLFVHPKRLNKLEIHRVTEDLPTLKFQKKILTKKRSGKLNQGLYQLRYLP